ncbi:MAG: glycine betaine/L-proline ABC transporter ATP-binding protein [Dehalococcoidia bacterium]|nr:MAG: glycine betaine/L-proline ABC transporter ATP-binding protein [Dehalococcoidia bacterium]
MANNAGSKNGEVCVEVKGLWKIFGPNADSILSSENRTATREAILKETGCVVAVRDVSFEIKQGELFVIMGLSGSGKSTLIRCVLRLVEPTTGKIIIDGEDVCSYDEKQLIALRRNKVSMIFQHFGLFPHRNVIDNVSYGLKVRGVSKEERYTKAQEVIEKVGLKGWEEYYTDALSGGMQQRVGIARALTNDPEILLMDEPFSGLDPLIRRQMQDELIDLQMELQKTILFVTHDLGEALKLGSYIAIMRDGEIIQTGIPEEVVTSPAGDYVREFVQDASPAKVLTAGSIMTEPEVIIYDWQGPKAAFHLLKTSKSTHGILVTRGRKYLGLVTQKRLADLKNTKVKSINEALEPDIFTCTVDALLEDLFALAVATQYPIPVVDANEKLVGEIDNDTILSSMIQYRDTEVEETKVKDIKTGEVSTKETEGNA